MCLVVGKDLLVCLDCGGIFIGEFSLGKLMCLDWKKYLLMFLIRKKFIDLCIYVFSLGNVLIGLFSLERVLLDVLNNTLISTKQTTTSHLKPLDIKNKKTVTYDVEIKMN